MNAFSGRERAAAFWRGFSSLLGWGLSVVMVFTLATFVMKYEPPQKPKTCPGEVDPQTVGIARSSCRVHGEYIVCLWDEGAKP